MPLRTTPFPLAEDKSAQHYHGDLIFLMATPRRHLVLSAELRLQCVSPTYQRGLLTCYLSCIFVSQKLTCVATVVASMLLRLAASALLYFFLHWEIHRSLFCPWAPVAAKQVNVRASVETPYHSIAAMETKYGCCEHTSYLL